ncbi:flagellar protein FlaG [Marinobacter sp.]|uniref:flagellar protein FlaG n=1 Tax=Marinobacter sp. TaxID=50741 RepID=UPI00384C8FD7
MNDVNLNSPDLKLVRSSEQAPARASASPLAEGRNASSQSAIDADSTTLVKPVLAQEKTTAEKLEARTEAQREELDGAVSKLNDFVQNVQRDLQFEVDNEKGSTIVRVVDQQTQQVIRQIPDELALRLAENLQQEEPLTLFNIKV